MQSLKRLLYPDSIAVVGGGAWASLVIEQAKKMNFAGAIYPVHPKKAQIAGQAAFASLDDLPHAPDACFIGVNRHATIDIVGQLRARGAGGAVCFASGFAEAVKEDETSASLQDQLLQTAGDMPILGPNCYGFINALEGALLWPDQHGCARVDKGVAILTQSSNIAINLTMQNRALPLAYLVTCGNMAQISQAQIGSVLLDDPRITAIGLHIEGFGDLREWEEFAAKAARKNIPLVALKVGKSQQAQQAALSHTASLAGGNLGAQTLLKRLGIVSVDTLPVLLETLKVFHSFGRLPSRRVASISCSGGEASLAADIGFSKGLEFPPLNARQSKALRAALGPQVALANPLDYHTYIWRDTAAMTRAWSAIVDPTLAVILVIVDYPREDICDASDWICATQAVIETRAATGANLALVATLPELLPEKIAQDLQKAGVVPLHGLDEAMAALNAAATQFSDASAPLCLPPPAAQKMTLIPENEAKARLSAYGLPTPPFVCGATLQDACTQVGKIRFPVVLKGLGLAHKTESGAVITGVEKADDIMPAGRNLPDGGGVMIEQMVQGGVAELLVGVFKDPAHGFVLSIAAGGTLTEILKDQASLLIPSSVAEIKKMLERLHIYKVLQGYRGKPAADIDAIVQAVTALQRYVIDHADIIEEIEINPLICTQSGAVAVDALIRERAK